MKKFLFLIAACVAMTACNKEPSGPVSEPIQAATPETSVVPAPTAPAQKPPVVDPVDTISLDVRTGTFNTQNGQLAANGLTNTGKAGYLLFGPYVSFQPGRYIAAFKGQIENLPPEGEVRLDISSDKGKSTHAVNRIRSAQDLPALEFALAEAVGDLEVRIHATEGAVVSVESYQVRRVE